MAKTTRSSILTVPNALTFLRLAGAVALLFLDPVSLRLPFYIVYTACGVTDALDGPIARATGQASEFGSRLDSISDVLFYAVMMLKTLPLLLEFFGPPHWILLAVVLAVRAASYVTAAVKFRRFASVHTYLNKLTGAAVFLLPYILLLPDLPKNLLCFTLGGIGLLASAEELLIHLRAKEYSENRKSIFIVPREE